MDIPAELVIIHEPTRLRILGLLYRETDLGFTALRDSLGLTAGNVASHMGRLEAAGLVARRDALTRTGFEKRFQITPTGLTAFESYLSLLEAFVQANRHAPDTTETSAASQAMVPVETKRSARIGKATLGFLAVGAMFAIGEGAQNYFTGASGSEYVGIGVAGGLMAGLASVEYVLRALTQGRA